MKTYERKLTSTEAIEAVIDEFSRAREKHPGIHTSHHHHYAVLLEEMDELWDEVKVDDLAKARGEAVQVAAMALRFLVEAGRD